MEGPDAAKRAACGLLERRRALLGATLRHALLRGERLQQMLARPCLTQFQRVVAIVAFSNTQNSPFVQSPFDESRNKTRAARRRLGADSAQPAATPAACVQRHYVSPSLDILCPEPFRLMFTQSIERERENPTESVRCRWRSAAQRPLTVGSSSPRRVAPPKRAAHSSPNAPLPKRPRAPVPTRTDRFTNREPAPE